MEVDPITSIYIFDYGNPIDEAMYFHGVELFLCGSHIFEHGQDNIISLEWQQHTGQIQSNSGIFTISIS